MFDATNARTAITAAIDAETDLFALELEERFKDLSLSEQKELVVKLREAVASKTSAAALVAGTFAQNNSGGPAAALGAGPTANTDPRQRLVEALNSLRVTPGQSQAVLRVLNAPGDPGHVSVEPDGTPTELLATRNQRDALERERDAARDALASERNATRRGSLAEQVATLTAERNSLRRDLAQAVAERDAALRNTAGYDQAAANNAADEVERAISGLTGRMGGRVEGQQELIRAINNLIAAVNLTRP